MGSAQAFGIEGLHPVAMVHDRPEFILAEMAEVKHDAGQHMGDALLVKGTHEVVVDQIGPLLRARTTGTI